MHRAAPQLAVGRGSVPPAAWHTANATMTAARYGAPGTRGGSALVHEITQGRQLLPPRAHRAAWFQALQAADSTDQIFGSTVVGHEVVGQLPPAARGSSSDVSVRTVSWDRRRTRLPVNSGDTLRWRGVFRMNH